MKRRKVSIVSTDLSRNCTFRCLLLATALRATYDVEIVGTTFGLPGQWGRGLWPPLEGVDIPIRAVEGRYWPSYAQSLQALLGYLDGEVILACKLRFSSFAVALMKRAATGVPVLLDIDDDELAMTSAGRSARLDRLLRHPNAWLATRLTHPLHNWADGKFCVSRHFQQQYGGVVVPHGADPMRFQLDRSARLEVRRSLGFGDNDVVVGFVGTPSAAKGVDLIVKAVSRLADARLRVLIVGAEPTDSFIEDLLRSGHRFLEILPPQPVDRTRGFLDAIDIVALPQRFDVLNAGQMPAKLTEAMAMAKPIIATAISDIPVYLDGRGLVIPPDDVDALALAIRRLADDPSTAGALGSRAREYFDQHLTLTAMRAAMKPVIEEAIARRRSSGGR